MIFDMFLMAIVMLALSITILEEFEVLDLEL